MYEATFTYGSSTVKGNHSALSMVYVVILKSNHNQLCYETECAVPCPRYCFDKSSGSCLSQYNMQIEGGT